MFTEYIVSVDNLPTTDNILNNILECPMFLQEGVFHREGTKLNETGAGAEGGRLEREADLVDKLGKIVLILVETLYLKAEIGWLPAYGAYRHDEWRRLGWNGQLLGAGGHTIRLLRRQINAGHLEHHRTLSGLDLGENTIKVIATNVPVGGLGEYLARIAKVSRCQSELSLEFVHFWIAISVKDVRECGGGSDESHHDATRLIARIVQQRQAEVGGGVSLAGYQRMIGQIGHHLHL